MWRDRIINSILGLTATVLAAALGGYLWTLSAINAPGPLRQPTTVIIAPGSGLSQIARQISQSGVISNARLFEFEARRSGQGRVLKPGEYRFDPAVTVSQVLDKLVHRDVVARFVTIPEGLVSADILSILEKAEGLTGDVATIPAVGTLLPETYRYESGDDLTQLVQRISSARDAVLEDLWQARQPDLPISTPAEAVILASIVEKETGLAAERGRVAAVFVNRLRKKMRLQSDPTVIYGIIGTALGRPLTRSDLDQFTPYNTYLIDRLPPTPICHPGRDSLAAVLNPPATSDLYFVADGSGGHAFAATLDEHNRNVARWRKIESGTTAEPANATKEDPVTPSTIPAVTPKPTKLKAAPARSSQQSTTAKPKTATRQASTAAAALNGAKLKLA